MLSIPQPAGSARIVSRNVIVRTVLRDGTVGYGEVALFAGITSESQRSSLAALRRIESSVRGSCGQMWCELSRRVRALAPCLTATRCGVEQALLDAGARRAGLSLVRHLGGSPVPLRSSLTVLPGDIPHTLAAARAARRSGFSRIKIKAVGPWKLDVARVRAVAAALPHSWLQVDAHGQYSYDDARRFVDALDQAGVELALFEQPTPPSRPGDLVRLQRETGAPICADESIRGEGDLWWLVERGGIHALNVKVMKFGVLESMSLIEAAAAAGVRCMIGGMSETAVSTSFSAALAAARRHAVGYVDLDTPCFMPHLPMTGGIGYSRGRIVIPHDALGTGIDASALFLPADRAGSQTS
ncbi:enolase C-terminal domain-like protein [Micromonospora sp. WMMD558]|uniref:enolase C-terminal domain-like protein n=1 Tax=Micromonospora sp. WMMD558 TaxID=3403462 RepID=UPI003BF4F335